MKSKIILFTALIFGLAVVVIVPFYKVSQMQEKTPENSDGMCAAEKPTPDKKDNNEAATAVIVRNTSEQGGFEVENKGEAVELDWQVMVERKEKGEWRRLSRDDYKTYLYLVLAEDCGFSPQTKWITDRNAEQPKCRKLERGEIIRAKSWTGYSCSAQCFPKSCRANGQIFGTFRFVVKSCDKQTEYYGEEFEGKSWKPVEW